jgi:hypothetical protein
MFRPDSGRVKIVGPKVFAIRMDMLTDLCASLADPNVTLSSTKRLLVVQTPS